MRFGFYNPPVTTPVDERNLPPVGNPNGPPPIGLRPYGRYDPHNHAAAGDDPAETPPEEDSASPDEPGNTPAK
jgi:hypothetical protein